MKQRLLLFALSLTTVLSLSAQDTLFLEDFADGFKNWTVSSQQSGNNTGDQYGVWELDAVTIGGNPFPLSVDLNWSFVNPKEMTVQFSNDDNTVYGYIYSNYQFNTDTLVTAVDGGSLVADGVASGLNVDYVEWAANLNVDGVTLSILSTLLSADDIVVSWDAMNDMTITVQGGVTVVTFTKVSDNAPSWFWTPNGNVPNGFTALTPGTQIQSETQDNGAAVINTVFQNILADPDLVPSGPPPYPEHWVTMTSSPIDISSADRALEIQYTSYIRLLNPTDDAPFRTFWEISTDGGETWSSAFDAHPGLGANNPAETQQRTELIPITSTLTAGATTLQIRFTFAMDFYFWVLDDIVIRERVGVDMQANDNFFAIAPNYATPVSQVEDMYFMSDIQNNGGETATNVNLNLTITAPDGSVIYNADKPYGDIIPDSLAENDFFIDPLLAVDQEQLGIYEGVYTVSHDGEDTRENNNTLEFSFEVTDTLFAKAAAVTRNVAPAAQTFEDNIYHYGNAYYVPDGEGLYARYVTFGIANADELADFNGSVSVYLYEWDGTLDSDENPNFPGVFNGFSPNTYGGQPIAFNSYSFDGTESDQLLTIPISVDFEGVPLQSGMYYVPVMHFVSTSEEERCFMLASEGHDYSAMAFITDSLMIPRHAGVLEVGDDSFAPTLSVIGFGRDIVPIMRMSIGNNPDLLGDPLVNTNDVLPAEYGMTIFPNPANERFSLQLDLPEVADYAMVTLYDVSGRILMQQRYEGVQRDQFGYNVSQLPSGQYFLRLETPAGARTEKLSIQH
jgi:hypothetical protein